MAYKKWGYEEDLILKVWCDLESCDDLAKRLDRSVSSVKSRLQTLGIKKKNVYANKVWTDDMEQIVRYRGGRQSTKSLAETLGVSKSSLKNKANRMSVSTRLKKNRLWTEEEMEQLKSSLDDSDSWKEVSSKVGRSETSCRKKAYELGETLNLKVEWKTTELKYLHNNRLKGVPYRTIAKQLKRSESSVRKRYARYKAKMQ
jgi:transposase